MPPFLLVLCLASPAADPPAARKAPAPLYTNDDLERVAPRRGDTGVLSTAPAAVPATPPPPDREARGEPYWRAEAERLRERLLPLRERAEELRIQLDEMDRRPPLRARGGPAARADEGRKEAVRARLTAVERRIREMEDAFLDRARREGALPGWLR